MDIKQKYYALPSAVRWTAIVLGSLLLLLIVLQILISLFADDYAAEYLREQVRKSSNNSYTLNFDELNLSILSGSVSIDNLRLAPNTSSAADSLSPNAESSKTIFRGTLNNVEINGIGIWSALWGQELHIGSVTLTEPNITSVRKQDSQQQDTSRFSTADSSIYAAISNQYQALELDDFTIIDGKITALSPSDTLYSVNELNLTLQNIRVDSASAKSGRVFITDDISLNIQDYMMNLPDSLNKISLGEIQLSTAEQTIILDSVELIPRYPKFEFGRKNGYEIDRIDLVIPEISIQHIAFSQLIDSGQFHATNMSINGAEMIDFRNKNLPFPPNQNPPLPHIALRDMEQIIKIDTIRVNDSYIAYNEYWYETPQAGTVTFENLNATITNVTNYPELIEKGINMQMDASAEVMGQALLTTHFDFPMNTEIGFHSVEGSLTTMPITALNPMLKYVAFVEVDEGIINHLEFSMTLNNNVSNGTLIMNYEDLKISLLDRETMEQQGIIKDVGSFLANLLVIKENNTPEDGMRAGQIEFERVQRKSVFNYWWKSLFSGMKDVITD